MTPAGIAWTSRRSPAEILRSRRSRLVPPGRRCEEPGETLLEAGTGAGGRRGRDRSRVRRAAPCAAMVGGWDFRRSRFNRAKQALRQVGSSFKPFVFGAALENGFTPADTLFDAPALFPGADGLPTYSPRNYYRRYYGLLTLRRALELSVNVTSVKLMDLVGAAADHRLRPPLRHHGAAAPLPQPGARIRRPAAARGRRRLRRVRQPGRAGETLSGRTGGLRQRCARWSSTKPKRSRRWSRRRPTYSPRCSKASSIAAPGPGSPTCPSTSPARPARPTTTRTPGSSATRRATPSSPGSATTRSVRSARR